MASLGSAESFELESSSSSATLTGVTRAGRGGFKNLGVSSEAQGSPTDRVERLLKKYKVVRVW